MRIGFDVGNTGREKSGCGFYADSLIRSLAAVDDENAYLLYPAFGAIAYDDEHAAHTFRGEGPRFERRLVGLSQKECVRLWLRPPADMWERLGRPDVIHSNSYFCPRGLPQVRIVYTLYDLVCVERPEHMTESSRASHFRELFEASLRADAVVAISEHSRSGFARCFPHFPEQRLRMVRPASRFAASAAPRDPPSACRDLTPGAFWLSVATLEPRKNLRGLLRAFARARASGRVGGPLVLVGARGWMEEGLGAFIHDVGLEGEALLFGYVEDTTLQWLYANCRALVCVSHEEGFGLPVIEAMGFGAPVVVSRGSGLAEAAGSAGLSVAADDEDAIAAALARLAADAGLARDLRARSVAQAARFSWDAAARAVRTIYAEVRDWPARLESESA